MSFLALFAAFWCGWLLAGFAAWGRCRQFHRSEAMNRRIGWGYGYGAGIVDAKHGRYDPTAPADGRDRR